MDCRGFGEWLDRRDAEEADGVTRGDLAAERHAAECAACAEELRDARELTGALGQRFASAPAGFTDAVMARLPARSDEVRVPEDPESPWPWWLQILFEPSAALGLALGILYALLAPSLLTNGADVLPALLARLTALGPLPGLHWLDGFAGIVTAIAAAAVGGLGLFRGSTLLIDRLTRLRAH